MTIVGFTGSRHGMTDDQKFQVGEYIMCYPTEEAHHGICVGADKEFHEIVRYLAPECKIIGHPPLWITSMASVICDITLSPLEYHERDRAIVDSCDILLATPNTYKPVHPSGTWYTIGYARKIGRRVIIVYPDGSVE
jgi:hypothetical protein